MNPRHSLLAAFALGAASILHANAAASGDLLIQNVTIVTPERSAPVSAQHVLIRGGRIAQISAQPIAADKDVARLDGRGRFLTPGIVDSHVHLSEAPGVPRGDFPDLRPLQEAYLRQQPRSYLYFGVTLVLDPVGFPSAIEFFEAQPLHPDVMTCTALPALDGYPALFVPQAFRYEVFPHYVYEPKNAQEHPLPEGANAAEHAPAALVNRLAADGTRCVKVFVEDGFGAANDWPMLSLETLRALRTATRERGLLMIAHANALDMQRKALAVGVDVIAHGLWNWGEADGQPDVPDEIAQHLRAVHAARIGFQPTIRVLAGMADLFRHDTLRDPMYKKVVPPALLEWYATEDGGWFREELRRDMGGAPDVKIAHILLKQSEQGMRAAKYLHDLGHPLLLGSDTPSSPTYGNQPGYDTYREMRFMAQAGIPLDAIFRAATINNARQFNLEKDYGTVAVGKIANLLLLEANPLETVRAWSMIDKIVLRGEVIERETLAAK